MEKLILNLLLLFLSIFSYGQSHNWVDSGNQNYNRPTLEYDPTHATQGETALKVSGVLRQLGNGVSLTDNSLEIMLKDNLSEPEDWSVHDIVTLDIYMEESPSGLAEAKLTLINSKGESESTKLILGWQLFQWENYQMTFPLKQNAYVYGNFSQHILKDVVSVKLAFGRYRDETDGEPYKHINFHVDNMRLGAHLLWEDFESNATNRESQKTTTLSSDIVIYRPKESNIEIGFSKTNGAISHIINKETKEVISEGNLDGNLWTMNLTDETELPVIKSTDFNKENKNAKFSYDLDKGKLKYKYKINKKEFVNLDIELKSISKNEIQLKAQIDNQSNFDIRKLSLVEKLCVKTELLEEALWPIQEGVILLPTYFKENRSSKMTRPPMFADLLAMKTKKSTLGIYLVQDERYHHELIPYHDESDPVFQPSNLCIGGESDHAYMYFELASYISKNEVWRSPSLRISIDKDFESLAHSYRDANGFNNTEKYPSLADKLGDLNKYRELKKSPVYCIEMFKVILWQKSSLWNAWKTIEEEWVPKLRYKGVLHMTHWQYGRDGYEDPVENHKLEDDHPAALPIWWDRYGSEDALHSLLTSGKENGFTFMPFTNWTVWNKFDPYTGKLPTLANSTMATRKIRGAEFPYYEYRGYMVEPWDDQVRAINDKMFDTYSTTIPQDYVFVDMTGERTWRYTLSESNKPSAHIYTQSVVNENARLAKIKPMVTEGVFDRILNSVSGYGQTFRQKFWNMTILHLGEEYVHWAPYPIAAFVAHDKVAFYQHNLNSETWASESNALLSYYLSHGYNMMIDLTVLKNEAEQKINKVATVQNLLASRTCGEKLNSFNFLSNDKNDKSKVKTTWGANDDFTVIANFDSKNDGQPFEYEDFKIGPDGFYAYDKDGKVKGGIFKDLYNGQALAPGDHTLVFENSPNEIKIHYLEGNGTELYYNIPSSWNRDRVTVEFIKEETQSVRRVDFSYDNDAIKFKLDPVLRIGRAEPFHLNENIDYVIIREMGEEEIFKLENEVYWTYDSERVEQFMVAENKFESDAFQIDFSQNVKLNFDAELAENDTRIVVQLMENVEPYETKEIGILSKAGETVINIDKNSLWQQRKGVKLVMWLEGQKESINLKNIEIQKSK